MSRFAHDPLERLRDEIAEAKLGDAAATLFSYCSEALQTIYHPAGTCRMGTDTKAPVSPELRFKGCDGLWFADPSVMPTLPRGHPNAVVAMIAHRAAELIAA